MIIIKDSSGRNSVILGTNGEREIQQALINRINNPAISNSSRRECERLLEYCFGNFNEPGYDQAKPEKCE